MAVPVSACQSRKEQNISCRFVFVGTRGIAFLLYDDALDNAFQGCEIHTRTRTIKHVISLLTGFDG